MSRYFAKGALIFIDLFALSLAFWLAFMFRFEFSPPFQFYKLLFFTWPYVIMFQYLMMVLFGVPRLAWRYIGLRDMSRFVGALGGATIVLIAIRIGMASVGGHAQFLRIPLGILAMDFVMSFLFVIGVRVLRRSQSELSERNRFGQARNIQKRTLLIGAGRAGVLVAKEVQQNPNLSMKLVGFVDDDPMKIGTIIQGVKVLGDTDSISQLKDKLRLEQAVITIASASGADIRKILTKCEAINLQVKIIPGIYEILDGRVNLSRIREVTIEDLLGREAIQLDREGIGDFLRFKRVLITGAGGSIGSELCRQVLRFNPASMMLLEQAENPLFFIHKELESISGECQLVPCIADICDAGRINTVFQNFKPEVVFHAAAHKHVPMMEWNPGEAIKNNIFGTKNVADAADAVGADGFVMISTDKAVNPTSIMGTTKRVAELYIQSLAQKSETTYVAVRFGNVLGSAGSVIPIFKKQIEKGGPVTVTHPDMKRYFMTIPEACQLVMQAATMGAGGEIFVLDMGQPVRIVDLARDLIRLSGFSEEEINIEFSGVRPGEKLFEELGTSSEDMAKTRHPKIFIGKIESFSMAKVEIALSSLAGISESTSREKIRQALSQVVPEMRIPDEEDVELLSSNPPGPSATIH